MEAWPLRHLVLTTPRLELRPDDDDGLLELAEEARLGVHPPRTMPFTVPWTDTPPAELGRRVLQYHWQVRSGVEPADWQLNFLVRLDGRVIGTQGLSATDFAVRREAHTGSWLGMRHQGKGCGTEMRAAVLLFAFDHLGATQVRSSAFAGNHASNAVSRKLGYVEDGTELRSPRGERITAVRLLLTAERFAGFRPEWPLRVRGLDGCHALLGSAHRTDQPMSQPA